MRSIGLKNGEILYNLTVAWGVLAALAPLPNYLRSSLTHSHLSLTLLHLPSPTTLHKQKTTGMEQRRKHPIDPLRRPVGHLPVPSPLGPFRQIRRPSDSSRHHPLFGLDLHVDPRHRQDHLPQLPSRSCHSSWRGCPHRRMVCPCPLNKKSIYPPRHPK